MSDQSMNNYVYQNLFEINEQLKRRPSTEERQNLKARIATMSTMVKQEQIDVALFINRMKPKKLMYTPEMFGMESEPKQLECSHDIPKSIDFVEAQILQYKQTIVGDDPNRMPEPDELEDAGYSELVRLIDDNFNGFVKVAEILGLQYQPGTE